MISQSLRPRQDHQGKAGLGLNSKMVFKAPRAVDAAE